MIKIIKIFGLIFICMQLVVFAQDKTITIDDIPDEQIHLKGFTLEDETNLKIKAIGNGLDKELKRFHSWQEDKHNLFAYAWILDARERKLVWRMTIGNTEEDWWNKHNRVFDKNVKFPAGEYELYFTAIEPSYLTLGGGFFSLGKVLEEVFGDETSWDEHSEQWKIKIGEVENIFDTKAVTKYQKAVKKSAIISLTEIGNSKYVNKGFTLKESARVRIYAIGEGYKGEMFDYGWIINAESRDKVWEMKENDTEYAGGAIKNRLINEVIRLDEGDYLIYFKTDGNHSSSSWNANPPYDPDFWGITLFGADKDFDKSIVAEYTTSDENEIISLNRMGDDADVSEGFVLKKATKLRIYSIGEGRDGEMFDYGWIEDAHSGKKVWRMRYSETEHAGGGSKNRIYDGIVKLDAGSYYVHFTTDDSHSYGEWNTDEPYDPKAWGIQIFSIGKRDISNVIKKYEPEEDKSILVKLNRVGDDEHVKKQFTLKKSSKVRIYAIGEGDWDEMYDYGWIEDFNTGDIVWEMNYKDTRRAGGSSKNRLYDNVVRLRSGNYIAHYQTDDSHAYKTWNTSPPRDRKNWGMTIYLYNK